METDIMNYDLNYINQLLINKAEENLNLDYKAAAALDKQNNKTTEISKDVSAMANSDGGIIIYGIKEDATLKYIPKEMDPVNRKEFSKEWLEQIINSKIQPRLDNFKIHPIEINLEQVIYVVEIKKSNTAHQAYDRRYYKRFNFQSEPMYDYEVRDILNRTTSPNIDLEFKIKYFQDRTELVINVVNNGSTYVKYLLLNMSLPHKRVVSDNCSHSYILGDRLELTFDNTIKNTPLSKMGPSNIDPQLRGSSKYSPILPTQVITIGAIVLDNFSIKFEDIITWKLFFDNAQPKEGEMRLSDLLKP